MEDYRVAWRLGNRKNRHQSGALQPRISGVEALRWPAVTSGEVECQASFKSFFRRHLEYFIRSTAFFKDKTVIESTDSARIVMASICMVLRNQKNTIYYSRTPTKPKESRVHFSPRTTAFSKYQTPQEYCRTIEDRMILVEDPNSVRETNTSQSPTARSANIRTEHQPPLVQLRRPRNPFELQNSYPQKPQVELDSVSAGCEGKTKHFSVASTSGGVTTPTLTVSSSIFFSLATSFSRTAFNSSAIPTFAFFTARISDLWFSSTV